MLIPTTRNHYTKYDNLCNLHGVYLDFDNLFGATKDDIIALAKLDPYLNNLGSLDRWDRLGFRYVGRRQPFTLEGDIRPNGDSCSVSLSEAVCMVKHSIKYHMCGFEPVFVDVNDPSLRRPYPRLNSWG